MPYRGLPYLVAERAGGTPRPSPYESERHALPDRAGGVQYSSKPRNGDRRVVTYRSPAAVRPARSRGTHADAAPSLADVEPLRILAAVMLMAVVAVVAAFIGIGVAQGFIGAVDGAVVAERAADESEAMTVASTPASRWEQGTVPQLYQVDPQWADRPYGSSTMAFEGAAPVSLAMARIKLTGDAGVGPIEVASLAQRSGFAEEGGAAELLTDGAEQLGLTARPIEASEQSIRRQINSGFPVICAVDSEDFGNRTAYLVLCRIDERGRLVVCDPASPERTKRHWDFADILPATTGAWAYSVAG